MFLDASWSFGYIWIILDHLETKHDPKLRTSASSLGYCVEYSHGLWHHLLSTPLLWSTRWNLPCSKCQPELCVMNEHLQPHRIFPVTIPSAKISMISRWIPLKSLVFLVQHICSSSFSPISIHFSHFKMDISTFFQKSLGPGGPGNLPAHQRTSRQGRPIFRLGIWRGFKDFKGL